MKILELQLFSNDLAKQREFYENVLGLKALSSDENSVTLKIGSSRLIFTETDETETPYYHYAFNIPENQIEKAITWLKGRVELIEYEGSPLIDFKNWNAHSIYFYDAGGNIVELIARHNLPNKSDEEFSTESFLNISEIGMPVKNVKDFHNRLDETFDVKLWSGNTETFAAIGDEEGLFIVVTTERNWFPTDKPCRIFPLSVKVMTENSEKNTLIFNDYDIEDLKEAEKEKMIK